jgi:amino acid adenylation domain-containing protein
VIDLVPLRRGSGPTLLLLHDDNGSVAQWGPVVHDLDGDFAVYGLQWRPPIDTVEALAERYVDGVLGALEGHAYHLCGGHVGAFIAWEMARLLHARGLGVGLLGLIDTPCPLRSRFRRPRTPLFEQVIEPLAVQLEHAYTAWQHQGLAGTLAWVRRATARPQRRGTLLRRAASHYRPLPYDGRATCFYSTARAAGAAASRLDWSHLARRGFEVRLVRGDHETVLDGVAEALSSALQKSLPIARVSATQRAPAVFHTMEAGSFTRAFEQTAAACADLPAIVGPSDVWSYNKLRQRVDAMACWLAARLGQRQQRVAVMMGQTAEAIAAIMAIYKAGAIFAPLDPAAPAARNRELMAALQPCLLLTEPKHAVTADHVAASVPIVLVEAAAWPISAVERAMPEPAPDELAVISYTSGSTGQPKGVMRTHGGLLHAGLAFNETVGLGPGDRVALLLPLHFAGYWTGLCPTLMTGATLYLHELDEAGPIGVGRWLRRHCISVAYQVPSLLRHWVGGLESDEVLPHLRVVATAGETLFWSDVAALRRHIAPQCVVFNHLGSSEVGVMACEVVGWQSTAEPRVPVGCAPAGLELYESDGELIAEGRWISTGYWNDESQTAAAFSVAPDGKTRRYRTGDRVQWLDDGRLIHLGRLNSYVKVRGFGVDLAEVQAALLALDAVEDAVVLPYQLPDGSTAVAAWVVPSVREYQPHRYTRKATPEGSPALPPGASATALRQQLQKRLSDYMIPSRLMLVGELPRTSSGKVDVQSLAVMSAPETVAVASPPRTETERWLAQQWSRVLGIQTVSREDDFFLLGGSSLQAARLLERIERERHCRLPMAALLSHPRLDSLAALVDDPSPRPPWRSLVPVRRGLGTGKLFCVHGAPGDVTWVEPLARHLPSTLSVFGLQSIGLDGDEPLPLDVESMAAAYCDEIRSVQPQGPYHLYGYSSGGATVMEMARQLLDGGAALGLLALGDASCPQASPCRTPRSKGFETGIEPWLSSLERMASMVADRSQWLPTVRSESRNLRTRWLAYRGDASVARLARLVRHHRQVLARYRVKPVRSRVTLLLATEWMRYPWFEPDWRLDWSEVAAAGLEIRLVPGNHIDMARHAVSIREVAAALTAGLQQARDTRVEKVGTIESVSM